MWFNIAISNEPVYAKRNRDAVKRKMVAEEIAEAQKLARECIKKNYKEDCG